MHSRSLILGAGLALVAAAGCAREIPTRPSVEGPGAASLVMPTGLVAPAFDSLAFSRGRSNPLFPLARGTVWRYAGFEGPDLQTNVVTVTDQSKTIMGVNATVVHDQVFQGQALIEDTFDWYATDDEGNVWYLGEDSKQLEDGVVVSTEGSWEAGINGAVPGIIMLAHPRVGDSYQQEFAAGVAEDMAAILSTHATASVAAGKFTEALKTIEMTPLEPGVSEAKFFAPGIGTVLEQSVTGDSTRNELQSVTLQAAAPPAPTPFPVPPIVQRRQ